MNDCVYLIYQKDFAENGDDRYFLYDTEKFQEVTAEALLNVDKAIVTHDYWLIANSIYKDANSLPKKVIDVVLLAKINAGIKAASSGDQPWDISNTIKPLFKNEDDFENYSQMYYRRTELSEEAYMFFSHKLAEFTECALEKAKNLGELDRFYSLEVPLFNALVLAACKGIRVDNAILREHKDQLEYDYYRELKRFAEKHDVLYQVPNEGEIREKLSDLGYETEDYSLDFLMDFIPSKEGYTDDLLSLQKTHKSYRIFNGISSAQRRIFPIVETHWTSTARIYQKSPSLQNISKRYRNIFIADDGLQLNYVDYDQFEIGVMAAISGDDKMKGIYENSDAYLELAKTVFDNEELRGKAKILFLSYTYGMSLKNILSSISSLNGNQKAAKQYFSEFSAYEKWKEGVYTEYELKGFVSTIKGNLLHRTNNGELSQKEKRTCVNHVIQGTATYIFKEALLELSHHNEVDVLIPMHDAALFQHPPSFSPQEAVKVFQDKMTEILDSKVQGKASLEPFYVG
ncbi:DNA polymerase [Cycloclasticus sp.]|jgi:DNA polymerase I|uniref:DNA polymerase n=1 Tax=Cycloclasticus sp. TaxID=2024830 RepID=UPI00257A304E|nr:DNA polymerase [Cycloclasticus sp.]